MPITYGSVAGAEPSTVTFQVETVVINHNSTNVNREIMVLGDPQTSNAIARVVAAAPVSTEFGLIVRIAGGPSSAVDLAMRPVFSSTAADNPVLVSGNSTVVVSAFGAGLISSAVSAANSSALLVRVVGGTSSAADFPVRPVFSSTGADNPVSISALPANSSQVEVRALPANSSKVEVTAMPAGSTTVTVSALPANSSQVEVRNTVTVTLGTNLQSTSPPAVGSSGLVVRGVMPTIVNAASTNLFVSSAFAIGSSAAGTRIKCFAYSITSTVQSPTQIRVMGGSTMIWTLRLAAISSAVTGANLAVSPPAWLFAGDASGALTINIDSSLVGFSGGFSYFVEP